MIIETFYAFNESVIGLNRYIKSYVFAHQYFNILVKQIYQDQYNLQYILLNI